MGLGWVEGVFRLSVRGYWGTWAGAAWAWAQSEGLMDGTRPRDTVTREELAVVLRRHAEETTR